MDNFKGFLAGAMASCGAVTITNPWEVMFEFIQGHQNKTSITR